MDTTPRPQRRPTPTPSGASVASVAARREIYNKYAETYHERFRAAIDFQFAEEPRQVIGMVVLIAGCCLGGISMDLLGQRGGGRSLGTGESEVTARAGFLGMLFCVCVYCFLQTRDGLLVRPHPGFWRIFHAIGLVHLILVSVLAVVPVDAGRRLVGLALPGLSQLRRNVFEGTVDLQCELSLRTLKIQMSKMWFTSHILGWFAKMLIFRDWYFCLILSVAFELVELSFQWLIPELRECWWDSIILDFGVSNMAGMLVGVATLRICNSLSYDWLSRGARPAMDMTSVPAKEEEEGVRRQTSWIRRCSERFLPFLWSPYHWSFFRTPERLMQATLLLCLALLTELNVFLMMYALDIPANHAFHKVRVSYLCFLAVSGVAETYNYVTQGARSHHHKRRIGHNAWLFVAIILVETFVVLRYGRTRFYRIVPDAGVSIPWGMSLTLLGVWCFFHFVVVGPERLDVPKHLWARCLALTADIPTGDKENRRPLSEEDAVDILLQELPPSFTVPSSEERGPAHKGDATGAGADIPERAALQSVVELLSLQTASRPTPLMVKTRKDLEAIIKRMHRQRRRWGRVYDVGCHVVRWPPLTCFLPLVSLVRFYDFD